MTQTEKIEKIAIYHGWEIAGRSLTDKKVFKANPPLIGSIDLCTLDSMQYATSMYWLHPIAVKVYTELRLLEESDLTKRQYIYALKINIATSLCELNTTGSLFNAVYDGIEYLNTIKTN